jgi:hypothetical protein
MVKFGMLAINFFLKVPIFTWLVIQLGDLILLIYGWFFLSLLLYF